MSTFIKKLEVRGREFSISVDARGNFIADVDGEEIEAPTLAGLEDRLSKITKKKQVKLDLKFVRWDGEKLKRGTLTGIHAANKNLLVKWEGKKGVDQESTWCISELIFLKMSTEEAKEYERLWKAVKAAEAAAEKFGKRFEFDPLEEIRKAGGDVGADEEED